MRSKFTLKKLCNYLSVSLFRRTFVTNLNKHCPQIKGRALVYQKTNSLTPFFIDDYTHTNNWEILCQVKMLNELGFSVDVLDRSMPSDFALKDKYDLFIGLGLDGSGRHYTSLVNQIPSAVKVLYAATSNPDARNEKLKKRYDAFSHRNNCELPPLRFIDGIDVDKTMSMTDHIFCVGNSVTGDTFSKYNKPMHRLYLSTSPKLSPTSPLWHDSRSSNFLFFAGNGNVLKGLDLLLETFSKLPDLNLFICTNLEPSFMEFYQPLINKAENIHIENFVNVGSKRFQELTKKCGFVILPSCSEGCATSVTTCMRSGLIPITTKEAGIDLEDFGVEIPGASIESIKQVVVGSSQMSKFDFTERVKKTIKASSIFTQQSYADSFKKALVAVIEQNDKLRTKALLP